MPLARSPPPVPPRSPACYISLGQLTVIFSLLVTFRKQAKQPPARRVLRQTIEQHLSSHRPAYSSPLRAHRRQILRKKRPRRRKKLEIACGVDCFADAPDGGTPAPKKSTRSPDGTSIQLNVYQPSREKYSTDPIEDIVK